MAQRLAEEAGLNVRSMDHTLVIPTYNRPKLVRRLVAYYLRRSPEMQLLVLDSSTAATAAANAEWLKDCGPGVRHVTCPETLQPGAKLAQGLLLVQTAYASFCADDDLVFLDGLREAIGFLEGHPGYVCAHGLYLNFQVPEGKAEVNLWREYGGPGNEAAHPGARIFRLFQAYESLYYAVFRTRDLQDIFAPVPGISSLHYQELFQSVAALVKGKVKRMPCLYAARQSITPAQPERDNWQTYYWFADKPAEVLEHYRTYCEDLWRFYAVHGPAPRLDRAAFQKVLDLSHAVYFAAGCSPAYFHSALQDLWPQDGFVEPGRIDLFDRLRAGPGAAEAAVAVAAQPAAAAKWTLRYVLTAARLVLRAAPYAAHRRSLDWRARGLGGTPWKCRLPWNLRWLAARPEFRRIYLDLCAYLDSR